MTDDLDIFRAAKRVIDQHGDDAVLYASGRADLLLGRHRGRYCLAENYPNGRGATAGETTGRGDQLK